MGERVKLDHRHMSVPWVTDRLVRIGPYRWAFMRREIPGFNRDKQPRTERKVEFWRVKPARDRA